VLQRAAGRFRHSHQIFIHAFCSLPFHDRSLFSLN
jgi:hypothetical protein